MKKILVLILVLILAIGCQTQMKEEQQDKEQKMDLPPPPPLPGGQATFGVGKAIDTGALPPWAAQANKMEVSPSEVFPGNPITLKLYEYDYIYQYAYYFNQQTKTWEKTNLFGAERTEDWIKGSAASSIQTNTEKFQYGENYIVAYACNKIGDTWACNNNKWMIEAFNLKEKPTETQAPEKEDATKYVLAKPITPFTFQTAKAEEDNFEEVLVMRYDAEYYEPQTKLKVIVRVFEFNNDADQKKSLILFKDIINQGWKTHNGQNVALYLDMNDVRNTVWTSGNKLLFIETYNKDFASKEIIDAYLQLYPSDLKRQ